LFPSDHPYGVVTIATAAKPLRLAVGRIPARTAAEASAFAEKIVGYETEVDSGTWRHRLLVTASDARFGAVADSLIESIAARLLDEKISYEFDLGFTFAKASSPYANRPDTLHHTFVSELQAGALIATYVG